MRLTEIRWVALGLISALGGGGAARDAVGQTATPSVPMVEPFPQATPPARDLDPICIGTNSGGQCDTWVSFEDPMLPSCESCEAPNSSCDQCQDSLGNGIWIIRGSSSSGGGTGRPGISSGVGSSGSAHNGGSSTSGSSDVGGDGDYNEDLMRNGTNQQSRCPVLISEGIKLEGDTDLVVPSPGQDFVVTRHHSGGGVLGQMYPWFAGRGWGLSVDGWLVFKPHCLDPSPQGGCADQFSGLSLVPLYPLPSTVEITTFPLSESATFVYDGLESGYTADKLSAGADDPRAVYVPMGPGLARVYGNVTRSHTWYDCDYDECFGCVTPDSCFCASHTEDVRVWILDEPGKGETVYLREPVTSNSPLAVLKGRILEKRDAFGNVAKFYYKQWVDADDANKRTLPRLDRIIFNSTEAPSASAWIEFEWNLEGDQHEAPGRGGAGHVHAIRAYRCATPQGSNLPEITLLGYVRYQYKQVGFSKFADLRAVEHGIPVRLPREGEIPHQQFHVAIPSRSEQQLDWIHQSFQTYVYNADSRIVAVYGPQQVEMYAERWATNLVPFNNLYNVAWDLGDRATSDIGQAAGGEGSPTLAELASKRVVYYTASDPSSVGYTSFDLQGMVKSEFIRGGCSCAGTDGERRIEYAYERQVLWSGPRQVPGHEAIAFQTSRSQLLTTSREYLDGAATPHKTVRSWSEDRVMYERSGVTPPDGDGVFSQQVAHMALRAPFVVANELEDASGRKWRTFHHFEAHNRDRLHHASSIASFTTAGGGDNLLDYGFEDDPQVAVVFAPGGLIEWTEHDELGRMTEEWAARQNGSGPPGASIGSYGGTKKLVKRLSYHEPMTINPFQASGTADRPDLVKSVKRYWGRDGSASGSNFEQTDYEYQIESPNESEDGSLRGKVGVAKTTSYREDVAGNGPGSNVPSTSWTGMTDRGDVEWTVDPVGMLTQYEYATKSGALVQAKRNASHAGLTFPLGWTPSPLAPAEGGWVADTLTTARINDSLGRPLRITAEDGTSQVFRYGMEKILNAFPYPQVQMQETNPSRLKYFTMWSYPHDLDGAGGANLGDGPLVKQWADASMNVIRSGRFVVQTFPAAVANGTENGAELGAPGTELSRVIHTYAPSGALMSSKTWPQVYLPVGSSFVQETTATTYVDSYLYDGLGRMTSHTDAIGNVTQTTYDVFDRVIKREVSATGTQQAVEEVFFDFGLTAGEPSQGAGDGNATVRRVHLGAGAVRDSVTFFDWRNRPRLAYQRDPLGAWTMADKGGHALSIIDNIGRAVDVATIGQGDYAGLREQLLDDALEPGASLGSVPVSGRGFNFYSPRGLVYRSETAIDPADLGAGMLRTDSYLDALGRPIAVVGPSGPVTKMRYDLLGRVTDSVVTDGASGRAAGAVFAEVTDLANPGDKVFESASTQYFPGSTAGPTRAAGLPYLSARAVRRVDDSGAGLMTDPILTYSGTVYDEASRPIIQVDFGTNTATDEFAISGVEPAIGALSTGGTATQSTGFTSRSRSLVTEVYYDSIGRQDVTRRFDGLAVETGPEDTSVQASRTQFDGLDRPIATVESLDGSITAATLRGVGVTLPLTTNGWSASNITSLFRVSSKVYDGAGNVVARTAHTAGSPAFQTTRYVFGVTDPGIASDLALLGNLSNASGRLYSVQYPHPDTGVASNAASDRVLFAYNVAGEQIRMKDQNETIREFVRDGQGRVLDDQATDFENLVSPMEPIDQTVERISTAYDSFGRMLTIGSYGPSGGPLNEVEYDYDARGRIERITQSPTGAANLASAESVDYVFEDVPAGATGNVSQSRLSMMQYPATAARPPPERLAVSYHYGDGVMTDAASDRMSRLTELAWKRPDAADPLQTLLHHFVGAGRRVKSDFLGGENQLSVFRDRTLVSGDPPTTTYPGLDRFGRVKEQLWYRAAVGGAAWSPTTRPSMFEFAYEYDRASQIRRRVDARPGMDAATDANTESTSNAFDRLGRLTKALRKADSTGAASTGARLSEEWTLDLLSNQTSTGLKDAASVTTTVSTFNSTNEIKVRVTDTPAFVHDPNGNLQSEQVTNDDRFVYTYDAWNRLTRVETQALTNPRKFRTAYTYFGNHSLATRVADTDQDAAAAADSRIHFFYDAEWRLLEERVNAGTAFNASSFNASAQTGRQYVWDPTGGPNELVQARVDKKPDASLTFPSSYWAQTDRMHSVIGLVANAGTAETGPFDRVHYRSYGMPILTAQGDTDGGGATDFADITAVLQHFNGNVSGTPPIPPYVTRVDVTLNGAIEFADITAVLQFFNEAESANVSRGGISSIGYGGGYWDPDARLCLMRNRWNDPELGRFITRDPAGYVDGMSMYLYAKGNPAVYYDPWGLEAVTAWEVIRQVPAAVAQHVADRADNMAAGAAAGATTGGATGAIVGSVIPGPGTLAGATAGAMGGAISGVVSGLMADDDASALDTAKEAAIGGVIDGLTAGVGSKFVKGARLADEAATHADEAVDVLRGPTATIHKNSNAYKGETHVYRIDGPDGVHKYGQSAQGLRKADGASKRAEKQVRKLRRDTGEFYRSEILKTFDNKADALEHERQQIENFLEDFGRMPPGNKCLR